MAFWHNHKNFFVIWGLRFFAVKKLKLRNWSVKISIIRNIYKDKRRAGDTYYWNDTNEALTRHQWCTNICSFPKKRVCCPSFVFANVERDLSAAINRPFLFVLIFLWHLLDYNAKSRNKIWTNVVLCSLHCFFSSNR